MDLNSLLIFGKVAELGSFTAAAEKLGAPKSFVSQRVAKLEDDLGLRLLQRTTRRINLTEEGQRILKMVGEVSEHVEEIRAFADRSAEKPHGLLRISAPHDLGIYVIRELLADFCKLYPEIEIEMDLTNRFVDLVEEGFDLALRASGAALRDSSLVATKLVHTALRFYCRFDYRNGRFPKTVEDLTDHDVVSFRRPNRRRKSVLDLVNGTKLMKIEVKGPLRTSDMLGCKHAVLAGLGIGLLPEFLVAPEVATGEMVSVLPDWGASPATLYAVHPSRRHVSAKARCFVQFLQDRLKA